MLDSSTSSSKKSTLLCSVPSTPTIGTIGPITFKQPTSGTSGYISNNKHNLGVTTSSIASSIQDSLNQLSLSTTSSQTNVINTANLTPQAIDCSDLGLPTEPIKMMNLPTSKQTSDYNSDTSSSNEWNSNTWSLSLENSNNRTKPNRNDCPKSINLNNNNKFKTPFNPAPQNKTSDKSQQTTGTSSANSTLLRNTYNSIRQQALQNIQNKTNQQVNSQQSSTLQEDLLRLINPDSYGYDNGDNLSEVNSNSSNQASNESSNTQYSTPYSSLERSNTSCSNKEYNHQSTNEDKKDCVQPVQVVSNTQLITNHGQLFNKPKLEKTQSMDLCKIDNQINNFNDKKKSQSASKTKKYSFDSSSTAATVDQDWPRSLVNNANKALAVTQQATSQANSLPTTTSLVSNGRKLFKNELQQQDKLKDAASSTTDELKDDPTCPSPATIAAATLNQHRNSLDEWIKEFENFSKNAGTMFGNDSVTKRFSITNSAADQPDDDCFQISRPIEPSQLDTEKVKSLEDRLKQLQSDLVREQSSKLTLEEQVKHLEEENRRLHNESVTGEFSLEKKIILKCIIF